MCCASCGKQETDNVKLKICTACKLVKYCNIGCQKIHRPQHKKACKKKAAELRDDKLFTQPNESCYGECPICFLPLLIDISQSKSMFMSCCCKRICNGCHRANILRELEQAQHPKCTHCREPVPETQVEGNQNLMLRVEADDPVALFTIGFQHFREGDNEGGVEYWTKATEFGHAEAHYALSVMYHIGDFLEKDTKKEIYHLEEAAIGGHPHARYNLGCKEVKNGRYERAVKHFIIAANLGEDNAPKELRGLFALGHASKEEYASALQGYQAAVDAMKSEQREEAYRVQLENIA